MASLNDAQEDIEFITTKMAVMAYFNIRGFIFILIRYFLTNMPLKTNHLTSQLKEPTFK